jgi:hypothetical protein
MPSLVAKTLHRFYTEEEVPHIWYELESYESSKLLYCTDKSYFRVVVIHQGESNYCYPSGLASSKAQNPFSKVDRDVPSLLWNTKVSLPYSQEPATGPLLGLVNTVHIFAPYFTKIHLNSYLHLSLPHRIYSSTFPTKMYIVLTFPMLVACPLHSTVHK